MTQRVHETRERANTQRERKAEINNLSLVVFTRRSRPPLSRDPTRKKKIVRSGNHKKMI